MKFDNEHTVFKIHVLKLVFAIIVVLLVFLSYLTRLGEYVSTYLGMSREWFIVILVALYIGYYLYHIVVKSSYISYNDEGPKIIIRSYRIRPLNPPKVSFEIYKNQLYKYSIDRTTLTEDVIIYQKKENRISKYPPLSVTALTTDEKRKFFDSLDQFVQLKE